MLMHDSSIIQIVWFHKKIDTISKFISNKKVFLVRASDSAKS